MKNKLNHKTFQLAVEEIKNGDIKKAIEIYEHIIQKVDTNKMLFDRNYISLSLLQLLYPSQENNTELKQQQVKILNLFSTKEKISKIALEYYSLVTNYLNIRIDVNNPLYIKFDKAKMKIKRHEEYETYLFVTDTTTTENNPELPQKVELTEDEINIGKLYLYDFYTTIHWGKYKNNSLKHILYKDPEYILRCIIRLEHFAVDSNFFLLNELKTNPFYFEALEINLIKNLIFEKWKVDEEDPSREEPYRYTDEDIIREVFEGDIDAWLQFND